MKKMSRVNAHQALSECHMRDVNFRFRMLAFTGINAYFRRAGAEPHRRKRLLCLTCPASPAGVSHL